jgi:hypothetical protein
MMVLILGISLGMTMSAIEEDRTELETRFKTEAPRGWAVLEAASRHLDGSGVKTDTWSGTPAATREPKHTTVRFLSHDDSALFTETGSKGPGIEDVVGVNARYAFRLRRKSASSPYVIAYLGSDFKGLREMQYDDILRYIRAPWQISGMPLRQLIADPGFTLNGVFPIRKGNKDLVRVEFDYRPPDPALDRTPVERRTPIRGGWILLSPEDHWAHQECELITPWGKVIGVVQYGEEQDGIPSVRRASETLVRKESLRKAGEDYAVEKRCDFYRWVSRDVPEREMSLAAFGLPEIGEPIARSNSNHVGYWFLGFGLLFGIVAVSLRVLQYRNSG